MANEYQTFEVSLKVGLSAGDEEFRAQVARQAMQVAKDAVSTYMRGLSENPPGRALFYPRGHPEVWDVFGESVREVHDGEG